MRIFDLSPQGVFYVVQRASKRAGFDIAPHDLRRTHAKLSREGGAPIEQISRVLGHASVQTTEIYLGSALELRLGKSSPDHIQLGGPDGV